MSLDKNTLEIKIKLQDLIIEIEKTLKPKDKQFRRHISEALNEYSKGYEIDRINYWNK